MEPEQDDILDVALLSFEGDFDAQVLEILERVRLTRGEVENLQCLVDDLEEAVNHLWPDCRVYPFGSIVTGLGIKTSDIDCFIAVPPGYQTRRVHPVILARTALRKKHWKFTELFAITTAKVPILKCLHIPTSFHCDISFTSQSGLRNSKLIGYLLTRDQRALPLAILAKYWSKVHKFTGTNLMPNYALTMMVIFYLQNRSILPPVLELQRFVEPDIVDNWDTAFNVEIPYYTDNKETLYVLLGGFFQYYSSFDYEQYIICPYLGYPIKRQLFENVDNVPKDFRLYKENLSVKFCKQIRLDTKMCIQDPFDHSRNCSVAIFGKLVERISRHFQFAAKMYEVSRKDEFLKAILTMDPQIGSVEMPQNPKHHFINKVKKKRTRSKRKVKQNFNMYFENKKLIKRKT